MSKSFQPKNILEFFDQHKTRVLFVMLLCGGILVLLSWRMYYMQVAQYDYFKTESDDNRIQIKAIPPVRGKIYDRQGRVLAGNHLVYNLGVVVEYTDGKLDEVLTRISQLIPITEQDLEKFKKNRRYARAYEAVLLRRKLSEEEVAKIEVNTPHLPGVEIMTQHDRFYLQPEVFAHVVGYVGRINKKEQKTLDQGDYKLTTHIGKIGVEKFYEDALHGTAGKRKIETDVQGRELRTLSVTESVAGADLYLTIDAKLQAYTHALMQGWRGSIVALDPRTFEVLAMVSTPSYDSNLFVNGISHKDYAILRDSIDRPLFNRSINGRYPPGSTLKPFLALAGLQHNVVQKNHQVSCRGFYQLKNSNHKFRDWKKSGHGRTNINKALTESCDVYFYDLAFKLGIDRIHPYLQQFYFGKRTGIDMPYETTGFVPSRAWKSTKQNPVWKPGETLNVGIGQGLMQASPLQLAYATATLANRGKSYPPLVVHHQDGIQAAEKKPVDTREFREMVLPNTHWKIVTKGMVDVVHGARGTARHIADRRYTIAGKTGTAQVVTIAQNKEYDEEALDARKHDHALFMAFAPLKNPKIAVAVIVENGKHGGSTAAPLAKKVMDYYLYGPPPKVENTEKTPGEKEATDAVEEGAEAGTGNPIAHQHE